MKVGEVARAASLSPSTVRYYVRVKMLKPKRVPNGYMEFSEGELRRLVFIRRAQQLGYTLSEVRAILRDADKGRSACPRVRRIIGQRIEENGKRLAELVALQEKLKAAARKWASMPDCPPTGETICHLIEAEGV